MVVETNVSNPDDELPATHIASDEPRKLTDPRAMRAVAHPIRIALLEVQIGRAHV